MTTETLKFTKKTFTSPDAIMECGHGKLELANVEGTTLARMTLEPGWKWSESVRPMFNTESCQLHHLQYVIGGRMRITQDDGTELDLGPGDFASIPPGHDAAVVGDEPFVCIDFSPDMARFANECGEGR